MARFRGRGGLTDGALPVTIQTDVSSFCLGLINPQKKSGSGVQAWPFSVSAHRRAASVPGTGERGGFVPQLVRFLESFTSQTSDASFVKYDVRSIN